MKTIQRRYLILFSGVMMMIGALFSLFLLQSSKKTTLVIGAKNCTEGQLVSEIIAQFLEEKLGVNIVRKYALDGTFVSFNALKANDIDLYVEYTGSAYTGILKKSPMGLKKEEVLSELRDLFRSEYHIRWMEPLGFQNSYVLLVNPSFAEKHGVKTISDLKNIIQKGKEARIGLDPEFYGRQEGEMIQTVYQLPLKRLKLMDHALLYMTLFRGAIEVINAYATDGLSIGYVILEDDLSCFPSYEAIPIVHENSLNKFPQLEEALKGLKGIFTDDEVRQMNCAVENKGESIYSVAQDFLKNHQLINDSSRAYH
jgi:glycine betaine/choline ABC-type transport system substrate-binding protein